MEENKQNALNTPGAIIIAGIIVAVAIFMTSGNFAKNDGGSVVTAKKAGEILVNPISAKDHLFGNPSAKIVVIEFSDTECPFCKMFHPTMNKIVADYNGQVAWVYRHFPIDTLHRKARKEAEATECAGELGGNDVFWSYVGKLFETTGSNDTLDPVELPKIAKAVGLDVNQFNACLSSGKYKDLVESHYQDGIKAGVTGTPSSVVLNVKTGKKTFLVGADSYENVKKAIDSIK